MKTFKTLFSLALFSFVLAFSPSNAGALIKQHGSEKQNFSCVSKFKYYSKSIALLSSKFLTHFQAIATNSVPLTVTQPIYQGGGFTITLTGANHYYTFNTGDYQRDSNGTWNLGTIAPDVYSIDISTDSPGYYGAEVAYNDSNSVTQDELVDEISMPTYDIIFFNQDVGDVVGNSLSIQVWKDSY